MKTPLPWISGLFVFFLLSAQANATSKYYVVHQEETLSAIATKIFPAVPLSGPEGSLAYLLRLNPQIRDADLLLAGQRVLVKTDNPRFSGQTPAPENASANAPAAVAVPAAATTPAAVAVTGVLPQSKQEPLYRFTIGPRTHTLSAVSAWIYGTTQYAADIASWNDLREPVVLKDGQQILVHRAPSEDRSAALLALVAYEAGEHARIPDHTTGSAPTPAQDRTIASASVNPVPTAPPPPADAVAEGTWPATTAAPAGFSAPATPPAAVISNWPAMPSSQFFQQESFSQAKSVAPNTSGHAFTLLNSQD